jgi:TrmH family RNA methyltransferase
MSLSQARRKLLGRLVHRKSREREGLFLVEGIRGAEEALAARGNVYFALLAPRGLELAGGGALAHALEVSGVDVHHVEDADIEALSGTQSPQGVILVCREPRVALEELRPAEARIARRPFRLLLLDGVQDPGNAGTLIRSAAAFALDGVVALDGTVDLYNPKVVRASAGGHFRIRLLHAQWDRAAPWLAGEGVRLVVADARGRDVALWQDPPEWALAVGSEADGVRPALSAAAGDSVRVPMPGGIESLNAGVAGSILLYMMTREGNVG